MRHYLLTFLATLIFLSELKSQVVIEGKIHHYDRSSEIHYYPTLEGITSSQWRTIQPNAHGEFKIKFNNEGYGTTILIFKKLNFRFFHDGNSKISFEIDQDKIKFPKRKNSSALLDSLKDRRAVRKYQTKELIARDKVVNSIKKEAILSIGGDYEDVNIFYNSNIRSSYISSRNPAYNYYARFIHKASSPVEVLQIIDSLVQIENDQVDLLGYTLKGESTNSKTANEEIKQFLKNEIRAFYAGILFSGISGKQYDQINAYHNNPDTSINAYHPGWEKLVERFFNEIPKNIAPSANSHDVNELIQWISYFEKTYQNYTPQTPSKSNDQFIVQALLETDSSMLDGKFVLDDKSVFSVQLQSLFLYLSSQTFYSPTLLYSYKELKKHYPQSIHLKQLDPKIEELKAYLKSSSEKFDKAVFIDKNYFQFQDLLELLKGKNIMIDVWATWCGPCIEEFKYKSTMQSFIDSGDLTILYISIDKPRWEKKWRENIKYNQLEGYHVLANDVLIKDMWNFLGGKHGAIPRYALITKEGEIFKHDAARPSQHSKLLKQINELLSSIE